MPLYEYRCSACATVHEVLQKISDPTPATCPSCATKDSLSKIVSPSSFQLKGGGWYADAYASKNSEGKDGADKKTSDSTEESPSAENNPKSQGTEKQVNKPAGKKTESKPAASKSDD